MKTLLQIVLSLFALYLAGDLFLYYLDCDILNVAPKDDIMKLISLTLTILSLYLLSKK